MKLSTHPMKTQNKRTNMKMLIMILMTLSTAAFAQYHPEREFAVTCQSGDLISNRGRVLYQFSFNSECTSALNQARMNHGRFCDEENLIRENGIVAHRFTFRSDCTTALNELTSSRRGLFCDDGKMYNIRLGQIADLTFSSSCREALGDAGRYRGLFCADGVMINHLGERLRDYSFNSSCRNALLTISQSLRTTF